MPIESAKTTGRARGTAVVLAASIGITLSLTACSSSSSKASTPSQSTAGSAPSTARAATGTPLTIGVIADETGPDSIINVRQVKGLQAWTTVANATGGVDGHPVKLQICDATSTVTGSITCAQQMGKVGIVVENTVTGEMKADAPILEGKGKVVITINPTLNPPAGSNLFQASPSAGQEDQEVLKVAKASGINKVGVITTSDASGTAILAAFIPAAAKEGETVDSVKIAADSVSATVPVLQLQKDGVGLIYDGLPGGPGTVVLQAAKTLSATQPVVVNASDVNSDFLTSSKVRPQIIYGVPFANTEVPALVDPTTQQNISKFEAQYKTVTGHALDLGAVDLSVPITGQAGADVLAALGPTPTLAAAESYLLHHTVGEWAPIQWSTTGPQDATDVPVSVAEAQGSSTSWAACSPGGALHC